MSDYYWEARTHAAEKRVAQLEAELAMEKDYRDSYFSQMQLFEARIAQLEAALRKITNSGLTDLEMIDVAYAALQLHSVANPETKKCSSCGLPWSAHAYEDQAGATIWYCRL